MVEVTWTRDRCIGKKLLLSQCNFNLFIFTANRLLSFFSVKNVFLLLHVKPTIKYEYKPNYFEFVLSVTLVI